MITKFKIFENVAEDNYDLASQFSQKFIEQYWEKNIELSIFDAIYRVNLWDYVDKDKVKDHLIKEQIDKTHIGDNNKFQKIDYIEFIKSNIFELVYSDLDKYRKIYNLNHMNYEEILDILNVDELIQIIEDNGEDNNFIKNYFYEKFDDTEAEDILEIENDMLDPESLYDFLEDWIDKEKIIKDYKNLIDFEEKFEYLMNSIIDSVDLQYKLIKMDPDNVIALFNIMDSDSKLITDYKFQKLFIKINKEKKNINIENSIKQLYEVCGLNEKIEKEYQDYMYLIYAKKYNL